MAAKVIEYKGVEIVVWETSVMCQPRGGGTALQFERSIKDADIEGIKRAIDAGRAAMAGEFWALRRQEERLLGER